MEIETQGGGSGGPASFGNRVIARGGTGGKSKGQSTMDDKHVWSGVCIGGPMNSQEGASRYPSGFLLVDRNINRVWIYDWSEAENCFYVRIADGEELVNDPDAPKNRFRAAEESEFDIRAIDTTGEGL